MEKQTTIRQGFFDIPENWREHWKKMPEFHQEDLTSFQAVKVHFRTREDRDDFAKLLGRSFTEKTKSIWYPDIEFADNTKVRFISEKHLNPRYPVYVISKGRWEDKLRLTVKELLRLHVPFKLVIEPQEYKNYASVVDPQMILKLPFSNLGQGSIPARNWVWEHAIKTGASRHWILDDNLRCFYRLCGNKQCRVGDGTVFRVAEEFVDRYENVALAGFNYFMFVPRKKVAPPYYMNTRIYSCILIKNDLPYRWRGRYNEDTDLSIRVLKDGWCTFLFNAFTAGKMPTMTMKGGNTDVLYKEDGRLKMAESLREQHPDVVTVTRKWDRYQHQVDYKPFRKNKPIFKKNVVLVDGVDNYGMKLVGIK